jgi:hypothetical protein
MRSEPGLILETGTKTIPIIFQIHRFVLGPPTPVIACFFSSTHYIFVNKLVTVFVWIIIPLVGKWQVVQITISFLHSCVIHLNNEYHQEQNIFHSDQACPNWCDTGSKFPWDVHVSVISHVKIYVHQCLLCVSWCVEGSSCYHMCILRLQPSLHLRLRFWTERKLVIYLTFFFNLRYKFLTCTKFIAQKI